MIDPVLEVRNLTKVYGTGALGYRALDGISTTIRRGESVAIVGKSGSGKSTLLHLLGLLDRPTDGSVRFEDGDTSHFPARKLDSIRNQSFGFVFQQFFLNARQSVVENVELPLMIAGMKRGERRERVRVALDAVGLADKGQNRASDLSGGERQRVAIARALVHQPSVLLADEPTGNLDSQTAATTEALLLDLHQRYAATLIVVTHDIDLARRLSRQILMRDGRVERDTAA